MTDRYLVTTKSVLLGLDGLAEKAYVEEGEQCRQLSQCLISLPEEGELTILTPLDEFLRSLQHAEKDALATRTVLEAAFGPPSSMRHGSGHNEDFPDVAHWDLLGRTSSIVCGFHEQQGEVEKLVDEVISHIGEVSQGIGHHEKTNMFFDMLKQRVDMCFYDGRWE